MLRIWLCLYLGVIFGSVCLTSVFSLGDCQQSKLGCISQPSLLYTIMCKDAIPHCLQFRGSEAVGESHQASGRLQPAESTETRHQVEGHRHCLGRARQRVSLSSAIILLCCHAKDLIVCVLAYTRPAFLICVWAFAICAGHDGATHTSGVTSWMHYLYSMNCKYMWLLLSVGQARSKCRSTEWLYLPAVHWSRPNHRYRRLWLQQPPYKCKCSHINWY